MIKITHVEFDTALLEGSHHRQVVGVKGAEWYKDGVHYRATHPSQIDVDVLVTLATLVLPDRAARK